MSTCTLCGKETSAASYPVFAANTSRSGWQTGTAKGTTTTYTDIVPLSFAVCPDCLSAQRTAKTKRRLQQGLPLVAVGVLAIIIGIVFQTPTRGGICLPMLVIVAITFGFGFGLLAVARRIRQTIDKAASGRQMTDGDLTYVFYPELRQLAERNGRDSALTRADYYRITAHPE